MIPHTHRCLSQCQMSSLLPCGGCTGSMCRSSKWTSGCRQVGCSSVNTSFTLLLVLLASCALGLAIQSPDAHSTPTPLIRRHSFFPRSSTSSLSSFLPKSFTHYLSLVKPGHDELWWDHRQRKRKRELLALTFVKDPPFWSSPSHRRSRRVSHQSKGSPKTSSFASSSQSAAASVPNHRLKILLNPPPPPGFGTHAKLPSQKCNYEIYPSGCFDENGSICSDADGLCVCRPGYTIQVSGGAYCLRPAAIGEACYTTEQCERKVPLSGCFNYREEYREENPSAFFGPAQSSWPMGECRCRTGHRFEPRSATCVRSMIGSWCSNVLDCELVEEASHGEHSDHVERHSRNLTHNLHGRISKLANLVCENNTCNCSQLFHYNATAEECQYQETYGQSCWLTLDETRGGSQTKRSTRHRSGNSKVLLTTPSSTTTTAIDPLIDKSYYDTFFERQVRTLLMRPNDQGMVRCNFPSKCSSVNQTCVCAEGFEHQPKMTPQCQPIGGASATYHYKGTKEGGIDRSAHYEGQSNVANFFEYVLYVLVPALVVIFMFKPCFRRIGEWRTHNHHYQSDSDFYLANGLRGPVLAEMNILGPNCGATSSTAAEKMVSGNGGATPSGQPLPLPSEIYPTDFNSFAAFGSHLMCHNAYLFDAGEVCYATPINYGCQPVSSQSPPNADPHGIALVREKLQTIEECQSEDGGALSTSASVNVNECANCASGEPCLDKAPSLQEVPEPETEPSRANPTEGNDGSEAETLVS